MRALTFLLCAASLPGAATTYDFVHFARALTDLEGLTRIDFRPVRMESSWDRAGGNNDAFYGRRRKGEVYTVADLKGPGVIRRFYTARPGGHLRIFLDDAATPAVDMKCEEFFSGRHAPFLRPAVGPMGGSYSSYFPIPYAKAARIEITALRPAQEPWGVYYQVTYETLPAGSRVETLRLPLGKQDQAAWDAALEAWRNLGRDPKPPAAGQQTVSRRVQLAPGERREVLRLDGAGVIDRFHLRIAPADQAMLRSTLLKVRWDREVKDAIDAPVGDFFGNGFNQTPYRSLPMGLEADGWYYSFFSMPFAERASISLVNEDARRPLEVEVRIVHRKTRGLDPDMGLFHAKWRREEVTATDLSYENLSGEYNYRVLDARGEGRFVGLNLNVYNRHTLWWGEGDPMIFVDGEPWPPAIHGTGTEEYFNDAWGFHQFTPAPEGKERNITPVSGVLVGGVDDPHECFAGNAVFSFHVADSIPFRQRILVTFEHGQEQNDLTNDYASTAYWYVRPGARDFFVMRPAWERTTVPDSEWPTLREQARARYLQWIRETLAEWAAAIPHQPNDDRLARPRAVFLMWALDHSEALGLPKAERERLTRAWREFQGTEPERRRNVDRILLELAERLGVRRP